MGSCPGFGAFSLAKVEAAGIRACKINLKPSDNACLFDEPRYGPASEAVPAWVEEVLRSE